MCAIYAVPMSFAQTYYFSKPGKPITTKNTQVSLVNAICLLCVLKAKISKFIPILSENYN